MIRLKSLAVCVATAVTLVTAWTVFKGVLAGCAEQNCLIPLGAQVSVAFSMSLVYAVGLSACCVPVWLTLEKLGMANVWIAGLLGFALPLALWTVTNLPARSGPLTLVVGGLPYAASGLVAAVACWATGSGSLRNGSYHQ